MAIKLQLACRLGSLHDLPAMKMLFAETIRATCNQDYNPTQLEVWTDSTKKDDRWSSIVLDQYLIIAEISTQIVGFCSLSNGNELDMLYVHPSFQRKGVASYLLNQIEKQAMSYQTEKLIAAVSITAKAFFEHHGFIVNAEQQVERSGVLLTNFKMSKKLI